MNRPLRKEGRPLRHGGRPAREGCTSVCCGPPPPSPIYLQYVPCQAANPHPCQGNPPESEIYLTRDMKCASNGLTLEQINLQTGSLPVIYWAGWCWVYNALVIPLNLPPNAISPTQPLTCVNGCSDPNWCPPGPRYVALRRCSGQQGASTQPPFVVCLAEVLALRAAGKKCPTIGFGGFCWYFDWANPFLSIPANYSLTTIGGLSANVLGSCCECLPEPCTRAVAVSLNPCPGVNGIRLGDDCCANGILGRANISWEFDSYTTGDVFRDYYFGSATRSGPNVVGSWTRNQYTNGVLTQSETFPFSYTLGLGEPFRPQNMVPFGAMGGSGPVPACPSNASGSWTSSCRSYIYNVEWQVLPRPGPRAITTVNYQCAPNPGYCDEGCPQPANTQPNIGPGGGDSIPDLSDIAEAL